MSFIHHHFYLRIWKKVVRLPGASRINTKMELPWQLCGDVRLSVRALLVNSLHMAGSQFPELSRHDSAALIASRQT